MAVGRNDRVYLVAFLLGAAFLIYIGRDLVQGSAFATWGLTFGGTTAVVVVLASLYRVRLELQDSRRQLARREAELSFAREVQRALFPRQLPRGRDLEFAAVCLPARGISGDYYDILELDDGRLVFAIADISGKGISAAILMANVKAVLRTVAEASRSGAEVCARLNRHLHHVTDDSKLATFFYGEWDSMRRRLSYVNAGHPTPIAFGSINGRLDHGGVPLGLFPNLEFQVGEVSLRAGDLLVLYSDGVTEATANGDQFGEQRLRAVVEEVLDKPLVEIQEAVLTAVQDYSRKELEDDLTLLLVRAPARLAEGQ